MLLVIELSGNHRVFQRQSEGTPAVACWERTLGCVFFVDVMFYFPSGKHCLLAAHPAECPAFVCVESEINTQNK